MTWSLIVDDNFTRADTSSGGAGTTTGIGGDGKWTDVHGGVASISSNRLKIVSDSVDGSGWARDFILRDSSESHLNQRISTTVQVADGFGNQHAHVLRFQTISSQNYYYLIFFNWTSSANFNIGVYAIAAGAVTQLGTSDNFNPGAASGDLIVCDTQVTGTNPTAIAVTVTNATTNTVLYSNSSRTDSTTQLQASGQYGLDATGAQNVIGYLHDAKTYFQTTATLSASPSVLYKATTGNLVAVTGAGTNFSGTPFTVSSGSITNTVINSPTSATLTINAPNSTGSVTLTDASSGATTTLTIVSQTISISPTSVVANSTGNAVTITGTGTQWTPGTPGSPTFTATAGTIASQSVASGTSATIHYNAPSTVGLVTITDPGTGATATLSISNASASNFTLTPSSQSTTVGTATSSYTVTLNGATASTETITLSDGGAGGTFTPSSLTFLTTDPLSKVFTYTPSAAGTQTLTALGSGAFSASHTVSCVSSSGPVTVHINDVHWFWSPYTWRVLGSSYAITSNPGAYFKLGFTGTSLALTFDVSGYNSLFGGNLPIYPKLRYSIDSGAYQSFQLTDTGSVTIANGLASGSHQIVMYFVSTASGGYDRWTTPANAIKVLSATIDAGATTTAPTLQSKRAILYGDSVTEGILSTGLGSAATPTNDDAMFTWAHFAANALGAEFGQIGFSGQGWTVAGSGSSPPGPPPLFTPGNDVSSSWDKYSSGQSLLVAGAYSPAPDYVFACMGRNDWNQSDASIEASVAGWLAAVRAAVPSAWIFIVLPFDGTKRATIKTGMAIYQTATPDTKAVVIDPATDSYFNQSLEGGLGVSSVGAPYDGTHPDYHAAGILGATVASAANKATSVTPTAPTAGYSRGRIANA